MKCRYCHKNVRSIAHFMQAHKSLEGPPVSRQNAIDEREIVFLCSGAAGLGIVRH